MDFRSQRWNGRMPESRPAGDRPDHDLVTTLLQRFNSSKPSPAMQMADPTFTYVSIISIVIVIADFMTVFILKRAKIAYQIRYLSISFLVADCLFRVVSMVYSLARTLNSKDRPDKGVVSLKLFMQFGNGITTCIIFSSIAIMAWDRVIALAWPLRYRVFVTRRKIIGAVLATWTGNLLVYSCLVVDYFLFCAGNTDPGCLASSPKSLMTTGRAKFSLNREHIVVTILLTSYELLNVIACCILTYQIQNNLKRRKARQKFLNGLKNKFWQTQPINRLASDHSNSSNRSSSTSQSWSRTSTESIDDPNNRSDNYPPKIFTLEHSYISKTSTEYKLPSEMSPAKALEADRQIIPKEKDLTTKATFSASSDEQAGKTSKLAVTKVILAVTFLQFCFHLPYIVGHITRITTDKDSVGYLETVSRIFLQLGTIPSLYLFVLKLRECQRVFLKLFCFRSKSM